MAITATERTNILKLIVGMFNAAPGAVYFPEIVAVYEASGRDLNTLAIKLSGTGAFNELYPNTLIASEFADRFLTPLGLENDAQARAYVEGRFNAGANRGDIIHDALALIDSTPLAAYDNAQAILANKAAVALHYSVTAGIMETDLAALQAVLAGVTADPQTVTDAIFGIDNPPQAFNLTINPDTFTGGAGNDVFTANLHLSTIDLILRPTLGGADDLEGGDGDDTMNAVVNEMFGLAAGFDPQIGGIENHNYQVRDTEGSDSSVWIDYNHVTGMNNLFMRNSDDGSTLMVEDIQGPANLGMVHQDDSSLYAMFDADVLGSATATQNVTIDDITGGYLFVSADGDDVITQMLMMLVGGHDNDLWMDVYSDGGSSTLQSLTISGDGSLMLRDGFDFSSLMSLDSTGMSGDLDIDIEGSTAVESVLTGVGDDMVRVNAGLFDGEMVVNVDLGGGDNTLIFSGSFDSGDLNDIDFSAATLANVGTLMLDGDIGLDADAALDVSTIGGLHTVNVTGDLWGNSWDFALTGPAALTLAVDGEVDELDLTTASITDLTITSGDGDLDLDSLTSDDIVNLTADADENAWVDLSGADDNLATLSTVTVGAGGDAHLEMVGQPGDDAVAATPGLAEIGTITFSGFSEDKSKGADKTFNGNVVVSSSSLPGGSLVVNVSGSSNAQQVADTVSAALDAVAGIGAAANKSGVITYTWDTVGARQDITVEFFPGIDGDTVLSAELVTQQGADATAAIPATNGSGFEALTAVGVTGGDDANVDIMDAYGAFTLTVVAGTAEDGDAEVVLINTGVTSIDIDAEDYVDLYVENAADLTTVTVDFKNDQKLSGYNNIELVDTSAVTLIDLSDAEDIGYEDDYNVYMNVDVTMAGFDSGVQILIGTADLVYLTDGNVLENGVQDVDSGNQARETFTFVGEDTGIVDITGFVASVGGTGDRLDFSQMAGIDSIDDLSILYDGEDTHITSLVAGVEVDITIQGVDVSLDTFHFMF